MRIGPGPVFAVEMIAAARRWQTYALRAGLVAFLFVALALGWANDHRVRADGSVSLREYAELGATFATTILSTQLALVLLAAPAATAGAICIDKARGNLTLLMTTDLSSMEIVLGKLLARLMPVLGLVIASLPVLFATSLLGGISGELLLGGFVVLFGTTLAACSISIVFSVYVGKTHEALLLAYFVIIAWLLFYPFAWLTSPIAVPDWLFYLNPFALLFAPMSPNNQTTSWDYIIFLLVSLGIVAVSTGWIIWRLRPVVLFRTHRTARRRQELKLNRNRRLHLLDTNPVKWYERHRKRLTRAGRSIWAIFIISSIAGSIWAVCMNSGRRNEEFAMLTNLLIIAVGFLLATIGAVTVLADERSRGNLDILLTTPLTTRQVVWGKWFAAFAIVPKILFLPLAVLFVILVQHFEDTTFFSSRRDPSLRVFMYMMLLFLLTSFGVFMTSVGLWLATFIKQLGRAVGIAVTIYVAISIGWMFLVMAVSSKDDTALAFIAASPLFASAYGTAGIMGKEPNDSMSAFCIGGLFWSAAYLVLGAIIYVATLRVFNRKMGRISITKAPLPRLSLPIRRPVAVPAFSDRPSAIT